MARRRCGLVLQIDAAFVAASLRFIGANDPRLSNKVLNSYVSLFY